MPGLSITRKTGESFTIGDDITVTIVDVSGGSVRVRITAPRSIAIRREEHLHGRTVTILDEAHEFDGQS